MIENPKWQEATSWLFSKRGRVESETTENKFWPEVRRDLAWTTPSPITFVKMTHYACRDRWNLNKSSNFNFSFKSKQKKQWEQYSVATPFG